MKLFLVCLLVLAALRASAAERSLSFHLDLQPAVHVQPRLHLAEAVGGGDGVVTGPARTAAWVLLGTGGGAALVGGWLLRVGLSHPDSGRVALAGGTMLGVGVVAAASGLVLLWTSGCVGCASCGVVESRPPQPHPPRQALAGLDPKGGSDKGVKLPMLGWKF